MPKSGRFSREEMEYIKSQCHLLSPHTIAQKLDRTVKSVRDTAQKMGAIFNEAEAPAQEQIKTNIQLSDSPEWELIKLEFDSEEIDYFQKKFAALIQQFKEDVLRATELSQIFQLIKFEILMSRNLQGDQEAKEEIKRIRKIIDGMYKDYDSVADMTKDVQNMIISYENQIASLRGMQATKSKELSELNKQHISLMRELKATRDQRISKIENDKRTWIDVIKQFQNEEFSLREGRQNEIVKLAVEKERGALSQYHEYQNGELDRPILNSNTIGEDEEDDD